MTRPPTNGHGKTRFRRATIARRFLRRRRYRHCRRVLRHDRAHDRRRKCLDDSKQRNGAESLGRLVQRCERRERCRCRRDYPADHRWGANWNSQTSGTTSELRGVCFTDANNGTAVGEGGLILHTTDGGNSWVRQTSGTVFTLFGVSFSDANHGTAVGGTIGKSQILHTTDGGAHWAIQPNPGKVFLFDVSMIDANLGTAVGDGGTILHTTDGGENWVVQPSRTFKTL